MADERTRRIKVTAKLDGQPVSDVLVDTLTYTDYADANSDSVSMTLDNQDGKYLKDAMPDKGDKVRVKIKTKDWGLYKDSTIDAGKMYVDTVEGSGGELEQVGVTGLSKPSYSSFSATERTHTYKDKTVKHILKKIAARNNLTLKYYGSSLTLKKIRQEGQSDLDFVTTLCQRYGYKVKIYNAQLIVYSASKYAKKKAVATIKRSEVGTNGYSYSNDIQGAYTYATNTYTKKIVKVKILKSGKTKKTKAEEKKTVKIGKKKIKVTYSHYNVAVLKKDAKVRKSKSGHGKTMATFKKGQKARIVRDYGNGWLKVAYEKTTTKKVKVGGKSDKVEKLFEVCKSQLGNHYQSKYGGGSHAWCAGFVTWCLKKAGCWKGGPSNSLAVSNWRNWGSNRHIIKHSPQPGDLIFWKTSSMSHIEIVHKVSGSYVYTYGGNTSGSGPGHRIVATRKRSISGATGFIRYPYSGKTTGATYKTKKITTTSYGYIFVGKDKQNCTIKRVTKAHKHNIARTLTVDDEGYSRADARRIAQAAMNRENESIETMTMTIPGGNKKIVAATNVKLGSDWGGLAGKWFVDQVEHSVSASSFYTEALTLHRVTNANTAKLAKEYKKVGKEYKYTGGYVYTSAKGGTKKVKVKAGTAVVKKVDKKGKRTYKVTITNTTGKGKNKKTHKITGWVSESQLKNNVKTKTVYVAGKSTASRTGGSKTAKTKGGKYVSASATRWWKSGQKWKVKATYKAGFSTYYGDKGNSTGLGKYEGLTFASAPSLAGKYVRISGTGTKWDGRILRCTDTGGWRVKTIHKNDQYAGDSPVVWIDLYTPTSRSGFAREGILYAKGGHTKKGYPNPKIEILEKV